MCAWSHIAVTPAGPCLASLSPVDRVYALVLSIALPGKQCVVRPLSSDHEQSRQKTDRTGQVYLVLFPAGSGKSYGRG